MVNAAREFARLVQAIGQVSEPIATALTNLAERIEEVARELRGEQFHTYEVESLVRQLADHPRIQGEAGATELEGLLGQLLRGHRDHEEWLTNLSRQRTADRLTSGDYIVHQEISKRYRDLIGQQLLDVAAGAADGDRVAEARVRAGLARALFEPASIQRGPEQVSQELSAVVTMPADRFRSLWAAAERIREDAIASGHRHSWAFDADLGTAADPALQEIYEGCQAEDPLLFVVAPAYVVDDKVYVRQLVFTGQAAPATEPPAEASATEPPAEASATEPPAEAPVTAEASSPDAAPLPDGPGPPAEPEDRLPQPGQAELRARVAVGCPAAWRGSIDRAQPANPVVESDRGGAGSVTARSPGRGEAAVEVCG
jgi:hypothetical protein